PQSPMSEEGVILHSCDTEKYIAFLQSQDRPIVDGGYLDVKFVRKEKPKPASNLNDPSTQSQEPNNVREKASEEEGEQSLAEASTSLEKPEKSSSKRSSIMEQNPPSGDSDSSKEFNWLNELGLLRGQPLYHNLGKVTLGTIVTSVAGLSHHRNPVYFKDPDKFDLSRFLDKNGKFISTCDGFQAFGI
ncbi:hypothetical protein Avbf_08385, partial [Armadillidium vulgare]